MPYEELMSHARLTWESELDNASRLTNRIRLIFAAIAFVFGLGLYKVEWVIGGDAYSSVEPRSVVYLIRSVLTLSVIVFLVTIWQMLRRSPNASIKAPRKNGIARGIAFLMVVSGLVIFIAQSPIINSGRTSSSWVVFAIILAIGGGQYLVALRGTKNGDHRVATSLLPRGNDAPAIFSSHHLHFDPDLIDANGMDKQEVFDLVYYSTRIAAADLRDRNALRKAAIRAAQVWFTVGISLVTIALILYLWSSVPPERDSHASARTDRATTHPAQFNASNSDGRAGSSAAEE